MIYKPSATHEKANQMRAALWSLVFAAIAAYLVWSFGSGAPWWVYAMLFARSVVGFVQALTDEPAMQKASGALHRNAISGDFEQGGTPWKEGRLSAD